MNYIEYTNSKLEEIAKIGNDYRILIVGSGYRPNYVPSNLFVMQNDPTKDLAEWCDLFKNSTYFIPFHYIIMCRVFEHLAIRQIDWYLYQLYTILYKQGGLWLLVPNMEAVHDKLKEEYNKENPDDFLIKRLSYEIFNEGNHLWDKHSIWTSKQSVIYHLEKEQLFMAEATDEITIDSEIIPPQIEVKAWRK